MDGTSSKQKRWRGRRILVLGATVLVAACATQGPAPKADTTSALAKAMGFDEPNQADKCPYGIDAFTIVYGISGGESGTGTYHASDCGRVTVEMIDTEITRVGLSGKKHYKTIQFPDHQIVVDLTTGNGKRVNVGTEFMLRMFRGRSNSDSSVPSTKLSFVEQMLSAMSAAPTDEVATYAGTACRVWRGGSGGAMSIESCVSDWGAMLYMKQEAAGNVNVREATDVRVGDPGPDQAREYDASRIVLQPSPEELLEQMLQKPDKPTERTAR